MTSGSVALQVQFPNWLSPPLSSLSFSSDCSLAPSFFESWFDLSSDLFPGTEQIGNDTLRIPKSQDTAATEAYFRNALPPKLREIPTYGEILDWEHQLREQYAIAVSGANFSNIVNRPSFQYFDFVIAGPANSCKASICSYGPLGFKWDQLGDLNGPGMFIFFYFQAVVATLFSVIVAFESIRYFTRSHHIHSHPHPVSQRRSFLSTLYAGVKDSSDGFSDAVVVFSFVLPAALMLHYFLNDGERVVLSKDIMLALGILAGSFSLSLWMYRICACIRRLDRIESEFEHRDPKTLQPRRKSTLVSGVLVVLGLIALLITFMAFIFKYGDQSSDLERFSDELCGFEYRSSAWNLFWVVVAMIAYCIGRIVVLGCARCCIRQREEKQIKKEDQQLGLKRPADRHHKSKDALHKLKLAVTHDPRYRRIANVLAILDVLAFCIMSWTLLILYTQFRFKILQQLHLNWFKSNWNLGQVLAFSGTLPIAIGFFRCLRKTWKLREDSHS